MQVEEKLRESYEKLNTGQLLGKTVIALSGNLDCESICDPPGGDALFAQGIYLTDSILTIECLCLGTIGLIVAPWKFDVLKTSIFAFGW